MENVEMKLWQHGYPLDFLKEIEGKFSEYNQQVRSPFAAFKKNHIAAALHDNELYTMSPDGSVSLLTPENFKDTVALFTMIVSKVKSEITMYPEVVIGVKQPGDKTIQRFICDEHFGNQLDLMSYFRKQGPIWIYILEEDPIQEELMSFVDDVWIERVGVKINTHSDIFGIYFIDEEGLLGHRKHPSVNPYENYSLQPIQTAILFNHHSYFENVLEASRKISEFDLKFTNHYSNYNKDRAWSALSLRGYSPDPSFITKPSEMNDKWKKEHEEDNFFLQDTPLAQEFSEAMEIAKYFAGTGVIYRVRFMRLAPGKGELERHTDQVDKDSGIANGKVMRIHVPLKTNTGVIFTVWGVDGKPKVEHFPFGVAFYLDTRKPHTAINNGIEERIHLVMDIEATDHLRALL